MTNKKNIARTLPGVPIDGFTVKRLKASPKPPVASSCGITTNHPFDPKTSVLTDRPTKRPSRIKPLD